MLNEIDVRNIDFETFLLVLLSPIPINESVLDADWSRQLPWNASKKRPPLKSPYPRRPTREIKPSGPCIIKWNPRSLSRKHVSQSARAYIVGLGLIKINLFIRGRRRVAARRSEKRKCREPRVSRLGPALLNRKLKADRRPRAGSVENDATLVNRPRY